MDFLNSVGDALYGALATIGNQLLNYLPNLITALVVLIIGILIAKAIAKLIRKIVRILKVDAYVRKINLVQKIEEGGTKIVLSTILGWLVKWFLYIALLIAVSEILELGQFTVFLREIAIYLPNVIIAVLILVVGLVLGDFVDKLIVNILKATKAKLAPLVGAMAKWSLFVFAIFAALIQLGVAVALIQTLFTAIVITIAVATGLAFGLGGRDAAAAAIEKIKQDINE